MSGHSRYLGGRGDEHLLRLRKWRAEPRSQAAHVLAGFLRIEVLEATAYEPARRRGSRRACSVGLSFSLEVIPTPPGLLKRRVLRNGSSRPEAALVTARSR